MTFLFGGLVGTGRAVAVAVVGPFVVGGGLVGAKI